MRKLEMTDKDIDSAKILEKVVSGQWTQKKPHETLKISLRQVKRLCKRGRGRDADRSTPPAQIRTCSITAYGSYLGCLA